jgi:hypothetical protein
VATTPRTEAASDQPVAAGRTRGTVRSNAVMISPYRPGRLVQTGLAREMPRTE